MMNNLKKILQELDTEDSSARRVFHGRGHCFAGLEWLTIDFFQPVLWVCIYKAVDDQTLNQLKNLLFTCEAEVIAIQHRYQRSNTEVLRGQIPDKWYAFESGLKYQLDTGQQNLGFFPDMQPTRHWLIASSSNKKVLNLFAYTCSMSVAAFAGGASSVVNVDLSARSLSRGQLNHHLNGFSHQSAHYLSHNVFKSWGKIRRYAPFDIVIVDPPTFQKGSFDISKDYLRLLQKIKDLTSDRAQLLLSVNSPRLDLDFIETTVFKSGLKAKLIKTMERAPGFVEPDENAGLKVQLYQATSE